MNAPAVIIPKPKRWFCSDQHHGDRNCIRRNNRPFENVDHQDEELTATWNRYVHPRDRVFVLGDFSFYTADRTSALLTSLHGSKELIKGNHDHTNTNNRVKGWNRIISLHEERIQYDDKPDDRIVLSHFAIMSWHNIHKGYYHLHGHEHGNMPYPPPWDRARILDVGIDNLAKLLGEYRPIELNEVFDLLSQRQPISLGHHRV